MKNYRQIIRTLLRRLVPAAALFGVGWYVLATASGGWAAVPRLLVGFSCFITAAVILAFPVAGLLAEPTGNLFYAGERFDRPQPIYSIPQSKRTQGFYELAMTAYQKIADEYPEEVKPYVEMIDIATRDLNDPTRALAVYETGMSRLKKDKDRAVLTQMYMAIRSRDP